MSTSFESILDQCIQDVVSGLATVDQCLARHPEHRAALEPALRTAFDLTTLPVPAQRPPAPERREALMAAIRNTPQQQPLPRRLRMPSLPRGLRSIFGAPSFAAGWGAGGLLLRAVPAAALVVVAVVLVLGRGASPASAATLTVFAGQVEQQVDGAWEPLADGAEVEEGLAIRTLDGAHALLTFPDGSTASLGQDTQVSLTRVMVGGERRIELQQDSGRLWNDVVPISGGDTYQVRTPHATVQAHGTVFETLVDAPGAGDAGGGDTEVSTVAGLVRVISGGSSVDVATGQVVRATAERIASPEPIPFVGEITVRAPLAAALSSPDGAATGLLPSGIVFRQVAGVTTTGAEDGQQHMFVGDITPGVYSLWLRRYGDGDGIVVMETSGRRLNIPVSASVQTARILIAIDIVDGDVFMRAIDTEIQLVPAEDAPSVRVVESARTRAAVGLGAARDDEGTPDASSTGTATSAPATSTATATASQGQGRQDTPTPSPSVTQAPLDPYALELRTALATALSTEDNVRLVDVLNRLMEGDAEQDRARLSALVDATDDPAARVRVTALLLVSADPSVRDQIGQSLEDLSGTDLGRRVIENLGGLWGLSVPPGQGRGQSSGGTPVAPIVTVTATARPTATAAPDDDRDGPPRGRDDHRGHDGDDDDDNRGGGHGRGSERPTGYLAGLIERLRERLIEGAGGDQESRDVADIEGAPTPEATVIAAGSPAPTPTSDRYDWWRR